MVKVLEQRKQQIYKKGKQPFAIECGKESVPGSVSQRACVFCGSRVVLYPIADALHLVHGPIGCAVYTWDIRGALSSGPELHRLSFSTDLQETDIIYGGEDKLYHLLIELIDRYRPKAAFVYSTCIIGIIGDDVEAVCKKVSQEKGLPVLSVDTPGFKGTKKDGYKAACEAIFQLLAMPPGAKMRNSVNILGDFNVAGEVWIIKRYFQRMGIKVVSSITGDGRIDDIKQAGLAELNLVQCSGSMMELAKTMQEKYGTPFIRVSYFGLEDMAGSLYQVADFFKDEQIMLNTKELVREEIDAVYPIISQYRQELCGKKAAIYVGGAFKAFSLVKALRLLGLKTVVVGSQTGNQEDYRRLKELCAPDTIIVDDANPIELAHFLKENEVNLFIGGVKERPIAYKLGLGFCDHNHERKEPLAGFSGMLNFAREVYATVMSPVWDFVPREKGEK